MSMSRQDDLREMIQANKPLNKKQTIIRLVVFLVMLALGVTFITIGVTSLGSRDEGLQEITAPLDEEVSYYELGVSFRHWFSGSSSEIRRGVRELEEVYAAALKDAYRILDPVNTYEGWDNLATVNRNLGREVVVGRELYRVLADALERTDRGEGYSVFSGALCAEWEALRYALEPVDFDPVNDPGEAERLARLTAATAERSNFSLELLDAESCRVRLTVSQSYLELLEELEIADAPILDLNALKDAWKLQLVAERLEERGYDRGYLLTDSGLLLTLSGYSDGGEFCLYSRQGEENVPAAARPIRAGSCTVQMRAFGLGEEPGYYAVEQDGETLLRHPWLPADGVYRELLLTGLVGGEGLTAPDACYACLRLFACDSEEALLALAKQLPGSVALLLRSDPKVVRVTDDSFTPAADYGYTVQRIS